MTIMMGRSLNELFEGKVLTWRGAAGVVVFVVVMAILQSLHSLINRVWWEPKKLQRIMEKQGWKGPPLRLFVGNMPDVMHFREREMAKELSSIRDFAFTARLHPQYALFSSTYGTLYTHTPQNTTATNTYVHTYILLTKKLPLKIPPISKRILFALPSFFLNIFLKF
jgi:hypothetical protein